MLLGPSGCGKTTTLRMIAGLELPTSGEIYIDGAEVSQKPASQRDIAFVFQMFALYPHMNVRKNISYPLISQGMKRDLVRAKVAEVAEILGITDILDRPVGGLSGGDRQRVALGRAIVRDPACFLMDEPLGALDAEFRERMAQELRNLHDRMGATTVYVTHDQLEAMQMGDKIVVMNHGVVEQFGRPQDIYDWPATTFVARFIGSPAMNLLAFDGGIGTGATSLRLHDTQVAIPQIISATEGKLTIRPGIAGAWWQRNIWAPPRSSRWTQPLAPSRRGCRQIPRCGWASRPGWPLTRARSACSQPMGRRWCQRPIKGF